MCSWSGWKTHRSGAGAPCSPVIGRLSQAASLVGIMVAIGLYLASLVVLLVVMPLVRGHVISDGERPLDSLVLDTHVTPVASEGARCEVIELDGRRRLRHSALYTDPAVIQRIAAWIQERLTERDRAGVDTSGVVV